MKRTKTQRRMRISSFPIMFFIMIALKVKVKYPKFLDFSSIEFPSFWSSKINESRRRTMPNIYIFFSLCLKRAGLRKTVMNFRTIDSNRWSCTVHKCCVLQKRWTVNIHAFCDCVISAEVTKFRCDRNCTNQNIQTLAYFSIKWLSIFHEYC